MTKAATVLVLGDPGPVRDELLLRREIDVIWAASFEDALMLANVYRLEACIVAPIFQRRPEFETFRREMGQVPCLVRAPSQRSAKERSLNPHYNEEIESVLNFLARHTGLLFARYPRADLCLPVTVEVAAEQWELETINISVSGLAIRGFPEVENGMRVELCIDFERPLYLLARVVRTYQQDGENYAGLTFTDLGEMQRAVISRAVEEAIAEDDSVDELEQELFGDLGLDELLKPRALGSADPIEFPTGSIFDDSCHSEALPNIRQLAQGAEPTCDMPEWLCHLTEDLTAIENAAALGGEAPDWAHRVLKLRISLARARADETENIPSSLVDEAYQMFAGLPEETQDAAPEIQQQVSSIRASLLRDVLDASWVHAS